MLLPLLHTRHTQPGGLHLEWWAPIGVAHGGFQSELSTVGSNWGYFKFYENVCTCSVQVHFLYQFSLKFFLDIFQVVLSQNPNLKGVTDYSQRLNTITTDMFQVRQWVCSDPTLSQGKGSGDILVNAESAVMYLCTMYILGHAQ